MEMIVVLFWIIASLILASAWAVVNGNDIVHAVVWLSAVFLLTACLFILAEAEFLADIGEILNKKGEKFIGHSFKGKYLDCGTLNGYIKSSQEIYKL